MKKWVKKKIFWILCNLTKGWYLCCHKDHCHKSQCICKYLFRGKHLSFERELNNQFNNLIIEVIPARRRIKDSRYSKATPENHICFKKYLWKSSFLAILQAICLQFTKIRNSFSGISQGICQWIQLAKL